MVKLRQFEKVQRRRVRFFLRHQTLPDDETFQTEFLLQNLIINDRLVFGDGRKVHNLIHKLSFSAVCP
jgi:hypothetical protein